MVLREIIDSLKVFADKMEFMPPVNMIDVVSYERKIGYKLPASYINLLKQFNGGELFIPGTVIYGIKPSDKYYSIGNANSEDVRQSLSIPDNYLIIGKLNFGDLICINLHTPEDIVQWDHENNEEFYKWDSIEMWLTETIEDFENYNGENK